MNLLYLSNARIPSKTANSVQVMEMCAGFTENGHTVTLLSQKQPEKEVPQETNPFQWYGIPKSFTIKQIPIYRVPLGFYLYLLKVYFAIWQSKADIVYGRFLHGCLFAARLGYPVIYESHMPVWQKGNAEERRFKKLVAQKSFKHLVVISNTLKHAYVERGLISANKIIVAHDGARKDVGQFEKATLRGTDVYSFHIGYTGSLNEGKGLEIIEKIAPKLPDIAFHIVGGAEKQVGIWRKRIPYQNVFFYGHVLHSELGGYINAFDVCLLPNQPTVRPHGRDTLDIGGYTSPLKLFEYMAHKKAVVSSDLLVLREVLENEKNALLVNPENAEEWISAIKNLAENKKLRTTLGEKAYADFYKNYTWETRAQRVLNGLGL